MKFTYIHITKDYIDKTEYTIGNDNKITKKIRIVLDNITVNKL